MIKDALQHQRTSILLVATVVFHAVFLISPIAYLVGFRASIVLPVSVIILCLIMMFDGRRLPAVHLILGALAFVTSCIAGVYWESWRIALYPAWFGVSLLLVSILSRKERDAVVRISSVILLMVVVGGWVSFLGALSGMEPVGQFTSATGRLLTVYRTTLTPVEIGNFIRPAGIYDEPGALSLVICVIAFLRHSMGMDRRLTWLMLLLGFVTFSLAHLIYVFFHFLSERRVVLAWANLLLAAGAAFVVLASIGAWEYFDARLVSRLEASADPERIIRGDNRSRKLVNAYEALADGGSQTILFGIDDACMEGSKECEMNHPLMGQTPVSPLAQYGILVSWSYYVFIVIAVAIGFLHRTWWPLMAVGLLFMQRPSVLSAGYSMLAALSIYSVVRDRLFVGGGSSILLRPRRIGGSASAARPGV